MGPKGKKLVEDASLQKKERKASKRGHPEPKAQPWKRAKKEVQDATVKKELEELEERKPEGEGELEKLPATPKLETQKLIPKLKYMANLGNAVPFRTCQALSNQH